MSRRDQTTLAVVLAVLTLLLAGSAVYHALQSEPAPLGLPAAPDEQDDGPPLVEHQHSN